MGRLGGGNAQCGHSDRGKRAARLALSEVSRRRPPRRRRHHDHGRLRWGCPTLVCPLFGDQPFWGRRVERAGAGPSALPLKHLSLDGLSAALLALQSQSFRKRAEALGAEIRSESGAAGAADLVEAVWSNPEGAIPEKSIP